VLAELRRPGTQARLLVSRLACSPIAGPVLAELRRPGTQAQMRPGQAVQPEARAEEHSGGAPTAAMPPEGRPGLPGLGETLRQRESP